MTFDKQFSKLNTDSGLRIASIRIAFDACWLVTKWSWLSVTRVSRAKLTGIPFVLVLLGGCQERTLPPTLPYDEGGVQEIRSELGIDESDSATEPPEASKEGVGLYRFAKDKRHA